MVLPARVWVSMPRKLTASRAVHAPCAPVLHPPGAVQRRELPRARAPGPGVAQRLHGQQLSHNSGVILAEPSCPTTRPADRRTPPIVIVGSGPAGMRVAAALAQLLPAAPRAGVWR